MKKLSVDNAIRIGHFVINVPVVFVFIIGFIGSIGIAAKFEIASFLILGFPLTFLLTWLTWSFVTTEWKIWAYSNCRNVHELERRAMNEQLIWTEGTNLEKYEFRTSKQKFSLAKLQNKFIKNDIEIEVYDDGSIPNETYIFYSKIPKLLFISISIMTFASSVMLIRTNEIIGYFVFTISLIGLFLTLRQPTPKNALLKLNSIGIETLGKPIISWSKLVKVEIKLIGFGQGAKWFLFLEKKNNKIEKIDVSELTVPPRKIEKLIEIYNQRSKEKNR